MIVFALEKTHTFALKGPECSGTNGGQTRVGHARLSLPASQTFNIHRLGYRNPRPEDQGPSQRSLTTDSPAKLYPGHKLSILQLLHALRIKLKQGELLE